MSPDAMMLSSIIHDAMIQKVKGRTSTTDSTEICTEIGDGSSVDWQSMADASERSPVHSEVPQPSFVNYESKVDTVQLDDGVQEASCTENFFKSVSYAEPFVPSQPSAGLSHLSDPMYIPPPPGLGGSSEADLQATLVDLLAKLTQPAQPSYHPQCMLAPDFQTQFEFQTQCMLAAHSLNMRAALCRSTLKHMDDLSVQKAAKPEKKQKKQKASKSSQEETIKLGEKTMKLKNQATLDFRAQKLRSLPEKLGEFDQVTTLILSRNKLASLPSNIGQLQKLQVLNLSHNFELTALPDSFGQLRSLQTLLLHDNKLSKLPENFGELESLHLLYLQSNKLTCLPESFVKLKALQILDLRRNLLTYLPESFGNLTRLQTLSLQYNRLSSLPKTFTNLHNLQELNLWSNPIPRSALPEFIGDIRELQPLKYGHPGSAGA